MSCVQDKRETGMQRTHLIFAYQYAIAIYRCEYLLRDESSSRHRLMANRYNCQLQLSINTEADSERFETDLSLEKN